MTKFADFLMIDVTESIFRIGSTSPASILVDAIDQLEQKSPKADDNIQLIRPQLAEAVDSCVKAAGLEFNIHWQKQLLKVGFYIFPLCFIAIWQGCDTNHVWVKLLGCIIWKVCT